MRYLALLGLLLIATPDNAAAGIAARAAASLGATPSFLQVVQEKRKSETFTERVKRAWKDLVGYKFDVSCPALIPLSRTTCTETGKDRSDARAKCISRNPFCYVADASR
jgi:hypothetical protein